MAKTAVLNKGDKTLIKVVDTAAEKKEFEGRDDVIFMTSKNFEATEQFQSWDEMIGKVKKVEPADAAAAEKKDRKAAVALEGQYHLLKPLPTTADDHPKKPIWNAIEKHSGGTIEEAKADCPKENPKRKTSGVYTFSSEFRYFLKAGYAAMGPAPDGHDHTKVAEKPKKEKKSKKAEAPAAAEGTADGAAQNTDGEAPAA